MDIIAAQQALHEIATSMLDVAPGPRSTLRASCRTTGLVSQVAAAER